MLCRPLEHQSLRAIRQFSLGNFQRPNVDQGFMLAVQGVKVGRSSSRQNIWITIPKNWLMVGMCSPLVG
jgi:hypothetical protein